MTRFRHSLIWVMFGLSLTTAIHAQPGTQPRGPGELRPSRGPVTVPNNVQPPSAPVDAPVKTPGAPDKAVESLPIMPIDEGALSHETISISDLGLTLRLPRDTVAHRSRTSGLESIQIVPPVGGWVIRVSTPRTSNPKVTVSEAMSKAMMDTAGKGGMIRNASTGQVIAADVQIIEPTGGKTRAIRIAGSATAGERVYLSLPEATAGDGRTVQGIVFFKPQHDRFVVLEVIAPERELPAARRAFDAMVAAAAFTSTDEAAQQRERMVTAGAALMARWTEADLLAAMPAEQEWFRLYKPAVTGADKDAAELGYRGVRAWRGKRSELGSDVSGEDNPEGYLVEIVARLITPAGEAEGERAYTFIDTKALYFLSLDKSEEAWSVTTRIRDSRVAKGTIMSEMGARSGRSMSVQISYPGKPTRVIKPVVPPVGYLSQVESCLLSRLIVKSGVETDLGFYNYRSDVEGVTLRRELLKRDPGAGNAWTLTTWFREGDAPQTSVYRDDGGLVRTNLTEDRRWVPTNLDLLMKLWQAKGLPTGQ